MKSRKGWQGGVRTVPLQGRCGFSGSITLQSWAPKCIVVRVDEGAGEEDIGVAIAEPPCRARPTSLPLRHDLINPFIDVTILTKDGMFICSLLRCHVELLYNIYSLVVLNFTSIGVRKTHILCKAHILRLSPTFLRTCCLPSPWRMC